MYFQYYLNVNRLAGSTVGLGAMQKWDNFLAAPGPSRCVVAPKEFNSQAQASIKGAWHASRLWSTSEAEKAPPLREDLASIC